MRFNMMTTWKTLFGLLLWEGQHALVHGKICYMVYQMADNDLEPFIRADLTEMTYSPAVQDLENMVTWIYFDNRNFGSATADGSPEITAPVENVFNADGTPLTEKYEGSQYITWDGQRMIVDTELPEQDSDLGSTVTAFVQYALTDCIAQQTDEYMLVFSSHGGGYAGFGADDNEPLRRLATQGKLLENKLVQPMSFHRWLGYQSNLSIRDAISAALASVAGAPSVLDVLGFDACLMQSVGALDEFKSITRYYLASEAVEPGHGWAYDEVTVNSDVLAFAINIQNTFLNSLHLPDYGFHATPKTLAVTDTSRFDPFILAWEELMAAMTSLLQANNDPDFYGNLHRARGATVSYSGSLDDPADKLKAAMDIGSFLQTFLDFCQPAPNTPFRILVENALSAYNDMFVVTGNGPGSPPGTGMHISWVSKEVYNQFTAYYNAILFEASPPIIQDVPNYFAFLQTYYTSVTPTTNAGSVCGVDLEPDRPPESDIELLIDPQLVFPGDGSTEIQSQIARSVDFVFNEFGIDLTNILDQVTGGGRRLREGLRELEKRRALSREDEDEAMSTASTMTGLHRRRYLGQPRATERASQRNLQENFFDLYGGDMTVEYNGANIRSNWDGNFFWIQYEADGETKYEPIYAFDDGGGTKSIPVCYFTPANAITQDDIPLGITTNQALALGCLEAYLSFNADAPELDFSLYAFVEEDGGTRVAEVPQSARGQIVPVLYITLSYNGVFLTELLGGSEQVILPWSAEETFTVVRVNEVEMLRLFNADTLFVEVFAYDDDTNVNDYRRFPYTISVPPDSPTDAPSGSDGPDDSPTFAPTSEDASSSLITTMALFLAGLMAVALIV